MVGIARKKTRIIDGQCPPYFTSLRLSPSPWLVMIDFASRGSHREATLPINGLFHFWPLLRSAVP